MSDINALRQENEKLKKELDDCKAQLNPPKVQQFDNTSPPAGFSPPKLVFGDMSKARNNLNHNTNAQKQENETNNPFLINLKKQQQNIKIDPEKLNKFENRTYEKPPPPDYRSMLKKSNTGGKKRTNKKHIRSQKKKGGSKKRKHKKSKKEKSAENLL